MEQLRSLLVMPVHVLRKPESRVSRNGNVYVRVPVEDLSGGFDGAYVVLIGFGSEHALGSVHTGSRYWVWGRVGNVRVGGEEMVHVSVIVDSLVRMDVPRPAPELDSPPVPIYRVESLGLTEEDDANDPFA